MFRLSAEKNKLALLEREDVTSGSVNVYEVRFTFSEEWDGLEKTAVFRAGDTSASVMLDGTGEVGCTLPWEVLTVPGLRLEAGVYGTRGAEVVLPTVWADLGYIRTGAAPGKEARPPEEEVRPPAPELWEQELARKGDRLGFTEDAKLGLFSGDRLLSAVPVSGGGSPVGTVISFMGLTAPAGYLVCDGAEYDMANYPKLAALFKEQFGSVNHFGGDGTASFAVPDMRNLFLRGFHGEAEERLSGEIGAKQNATASPNLFLDFANNSGPTGLCEDHKTNAVQDADSLSPSMGYSRFKGSFSTDKGWQYSTHYTSRPVNMAVLYCIKAV